MNLGKSSSMDANEEIPALIETLLATEQRLEELTGGEVDTVAGRDGRTFLLRRAQEQLRYSEAAKQTAILNALPANIALLDVQGVIVSVNEAWRQFAISNVLHAPGHGLGLNYLNICDRAQGDFSSEAHGVAAGIRAVLDGTEKSFSIEYPCHSDTEERWFQLTVTPLAENRRSGVVVMHLNITERKRAGEALRESEKRFVGAFEHAPIGMALVSPAGQWLKVNQILCDIVGCSEAELLTRTFQEITHPDDLNADRECVRKMMQGEIRSYQMEKRYIHSRGHFVTVSLNVSLVRDGQGQPRYFIAHVQDITERKRAEESLRLLGSAVAQISEAIVITDAQLDFSGPKILFVNPAFTKVTGYTAEEALGKTPRILQGPHSDRALLRRLRETLSRGEVFEGESINYRKDRTEFNVEWHMAPLRDASGTITHFVAIQRNITQRKQAENALRESEAEFRILAEAMPQIIWVARPDGWHTHFNQRWMNYTGRTLEESLGHGWLPLFHPDDQPIAAKRWKHANATGHPYEIEHRLRGADGNYRWMLGRAVPLRDTAGVIVKWLGTCTDIHGLKEAEQQRRQSEEKLRRTEELYRRAIAGAGAVPYSSDYKSKSYLFMGEGIQQLIGYSPKEVTGQLWKQIIQESVMTGDTAGFSKEEAARRMTTGTINSWRCDMRVLTREGKSRWLSDSSVQSLDETGKPIGSTGILQDITERKLAEISTLALAKLSRDLSSASSAKEAAQLILDVSDTLLTWDSCWISLYDSGKDVMRPVLQMDTSNGKRFVVPLMDSRPISDLQRRILDFGAQLILRENTNTFLPGARPIGDTTRPSDSLMFVPIRNRNRNVGVLSIQSYTRNAYTKENLTTLQSLADQCGGALERISTDEALRKSEEKFRQLADHISDTFWIAPPDFKGMHYVSPGYEKIWARKRDDLYARPQDWEDALAPEDRERVFSVFARLMNNEPQVNLEYRILRPDGTVRWIHDRGFQVRDADGKLIRLTGIASDITDRKAAEAALEEANRQLREASRHAGMSEVATSVLHNVGNVLNSVNVSCSIIANKVRKTRISSVTKTAELLREHAGDLSEFLTNHETGKKLPEYLSKLALQLAAEQKSVLDEVKSLSANIEHIKSVIIMQQTHAKNLGGHREALPIQELLEDALRLNEGALSRHRIKVVREFFDAPVVLVEKHKVLQILVNLLRNAKHALTESGRDDKLLTLRIALNPVGVALSVIDNGIGIPPENLNRIFGHRFTTKKDGHGFGLHSGAIAAQEMGGSLTVKSDGVGTGATFTLSLPLGSDEK